MLALYIVLKFPLYQLLHLVLKRLVSLFRLPLCQTLPVYASIRMHWNTIFIPLTIFP
ncbi:MAG: hypothetical protein LUH53_08690 [Lachnospiraceae bacterium]|nr:hypothetical protein [Lachnospiraceae bacterium]